MQLFYFVAEDQILTHVKVDKLRTCGTHAMQLMQTIEYERGRFLDKMERFRYKWFLLGGATSK